MSKRGKGSASLSPAFLRYIVKFSLSPPPARRQDDLVGVKNHQLCFNENWMSGGSALFSVALYVGGFAIWPIKPEFAQLVKHPLVYAAAFLLTVLLTLFLHELLHLQAAPGGVFARDAQLGFYARKFMFYAYTSESLSRNRAVLFLLVPFMVLTVLITLLQMLFGWQTGWPGVVAVVNASLSANDLILATVIFLRIPKQASDVRPEIHRVRYCLADVARS
jgi:Putative zincin peptidase